MKKARDNNYVILGAFQKKDNNEHDKYVSLVSRYDDNYYDNLENIEEEVINDQSEVENLIQMLNENARKSNRY